MEYDSASLKTGVVVSEGWHPARYINSILLCDTSQNHNNDFTTRLLSPSVINVGVLQPFTVKNRGGMWNTLCLEEEV
jgi:hypothetical protein